MSTVSKLVGKYTPTSTIPIHEFLSKFISTFTSVVGTSPYLESFDVVCSFIKPLLEGSAFNEVSSPSVNDFVSLEKALRARFGKTEEEVISELLSLKQGNLSVDEYLDKLSELCNQAPIQSSYLYTAAK